MEQRLNYGYKIEEAINERLELKRFSYKGKNYNTIREISKDVGLPEKLIRGRLDRGVSLEKAISLGKKVSQQGKYNLTILKKKYKVS